MPSQSQKTINNLYFVLSEELYYTEPILDDGTGPTYPYKIADLVIADSPGQAKWLAWKKDNELNHSGFYNDMRDMPKFSVKLKKKNIKRKKGIVSEINMYQKYWES